MLKRILSNSGVTETDSRLVDEDKAGWLVRRMNSGEIPGSLSGSELSDSSKKTDGSENNCPVALPEPIVSSLSVDDPEASLTLSLPAMN